MHGNRRPVRRLELPQRAPRHQELAHCQRTCGARLAEKCPRVVRQVRVRFVDALQAQQPVLEVARQWHTRNACGHRIDHRRSEPEQRLVRVGFLRPLVDQLGKVFHVTEGIGFGRRQRRAHRFHVVHLNQLMAFSLQVADPAICQRLQRTAKTAAALPRVLCHAALLAPIARQEHDDAIGFTEFVGPENQRVGSVKRHPEAGYYPTSDPVR